MAKHNILVICSDEHHAGIASYAGNPYVHTPNLDRLVQRGVNFDHCYSNCPVCTPSRMSFITGKYVHQIDSWFIGVPLNREEMTWPRRLEQAGIPATMLGKMDFCGKYQDGGFGDYKIIEKRGAFYPYPRCSPLMSRLSGYIREDKREHVIHAGIRPDVVTDGSHGHSDALGFYDHDRIVTQWAEEYLKEKGQEKNSKPWALYVGLLYPHWPYTVPKKYFDLYYPDRVVWPYDMVIPDNPALPPEIRHFQHAQNLTNLTEDDIRRTLAAYYGMVTYLDECIGKIINQLEAQGMLENTYIIYTSDHGDSLGEHGLFYKQCSYEGSVRVPLIMSGPGIPQGQTYHEAVSLIDMYPTILDFAGLEKEPDRPGQSWKKLVNAPARKRVVFSEYHGNFFRKDWYLLTDGQYKYTYYIDGKCTLFDLSEDPQEMRDLSEDKKYQSIVKHFEKQLFSMVDPEEISMRSKKDLGLIGSHGEDYTETLTAEELQEGYRTGRFPFQPEFQDSFEI